MNDNDSIFKGYDHQELEKKWIKKWAEEQLYKTPDLKKGEKKYYSLYSFPYPSGSGLHVGHAEGMVANDIMARYHRMKGDKVTLPMGWDSFGLPAENYAIKTGVPPHESTEDAIATFIEQIDKLGISVDWEKEVGAHRPDYYKWTQWFFTQLYKHGLAYKAAAPVNWCPKDQTVLANEQVIDGKCERCDSLVETKEMEQWFFKITDYAERLIDGLSKVDWPASTKTAQVNWIGKSEGINLDYPVPVYSQIFLASGNKSKRERINKVFKNANLDIEVLTSDDLKLDEVVIKEEGSLLENALEKARAYKYQVKDMPIIGMDTGIFLDNVLIDPVKLKRNALGDRKEENLNQEQLAELMSEYYRNLASDNGGELKGHFKDAVAVITPDGKETVFEIKREIILTEKQIGERDIYFPLNSLYKILPANKYFHESSEEEKAEWLREFSTELIKSVTKIITAYTTRPDTNFGATFLVLAPDSNFIKENIEKLPNKEEVKKYVEKALKKSNLERVAEGKEKTGVFTGWYAINQLNRKKLPVYVSDFVLATVGTGAVVGVPGHDKRDFEFAKKMGLEIVRVVKNSDEDESEIMNIDQVQEESGVMINSSFLDGREIQEAKEVIKDYYEKIGWGRRVINYKLRDWLISRQRYWGAPIPVIWQKREKPDKVVMIHGLAGDGEKNWFPWLKKELFPLEVYNPTFPDSARPIFNSWYKTLEDIRPTSKTSIVAHSLGGYVALKFAEENKLKQLVLVAPVHQADEKYIKHIEQYNLAIDYIRNFQNDTFDVEKIVNNVEEIVFIFSDNDPYIIPHVRERFIKDFEKYSNVEIKILLNRGHMGSDVNCKELPELLDYFKDKQYKALPTEDLPLVLPEDVDFIPKGYSPLSRSKEYSNRIREKYGEAWTPEYDTMDTFVCSSWYYFRYISPDNNEVFAETKQLNNWLPVDLYMIGAEHIVLHLLYSRFFTKFLYDLNLIDFDEPFALMRHMGMILGPDNRKMSKRWGNVINPNDVVEKYGADTLRMYEMFMGPLDQSKAWNDSSVQGVRRFLERISKFAENEDFKESEATHVALNQAIKKITEDTEQLKFNTVVSEFMKLMNIIEESGIGKEDWEKFIQVLAPFAPFLSEEIWRNKMNKDGSIHLSNWPEYSKDLLASQEVSIAVQYNGKTRGMITVPPDSTQDEVITQIGKEEKFARYGSKEYKKIIYVPNRIINFVV